MAIAKEDWILLALRQTPLDRIHIMKALFLVWHRSGRAMKDYLVFEPYLYGPCSFEIYSALANLSADGVIVQPPHPVPEWADYYVTARGRKRVEEIAKAVPTRTQKLVDEVVTEISRLSFNELLRKVYTEAPDFAVNSMFKGITK